MGEYNAIGEGGFNRLVSSRMNTDSSSPAPTLAPEVIPVFEVDANPIVRPEQCYQRGEKLCAAGGEVLGVLDNPYFTLHNPAGSGVLVTFEGCTWSSSAADRYMVLLRFVAAVGGGITETARDTRWGKGVSQRGRPSAIVNAGTAAPFAVNDLIAEIDALTSDLRCEYNGAIILIPGSTLAVQADTAGVDIRTFEFRWRERPLLPSELD